MWKLLCAKQSTTFLRVALYILGGVVFFLCVFFIPRVIGSFSFLGYDPVLVLMYIPAIPFYQALYATHRLLLAIDEERVFSKNSVMALAIIKRSGFVIAIFYAFLLPYVFVLADFDNAPGLVLIGVCIVCIAFGVAVFSGVLEKLLATAVDMKKENDLTI